MTNNAPVLPAETTISDSFFLTLSTANHILVCLPLLTAVRAVSSLEIFLSV